MDTVLVDDKRPHQCCVVEPRCRLCQFEVEDGDPVLVVRGFNPSPPFPFHLRESYTFNDSSGATTYHLCCRKRCMRRNSVAACFHQDCYAFKPSPLSPNFIPATHHDFTPSASDGVRRRRRIQRTLTRKLGLGILGAMPEELCYMVAEHLIRECAIINLQELTSQFYVFPLDVDLSRDVYATYVSFEGIQYVQSLQNNPHPDSGDKMGELLFDAEQGHDLRNVYVSYDHLGVRGVHMETSEITSPPSVLATRGMWWRSLSNGHRLRSLRVKSDGLKIRQVLENTPPGEDEPDARHGWAIPGPDRTLIDLEKGRIAPKVPESLRMSFLSFNKPGTDGYAAAIEGFHLMKLVAHRPGGDTDFYNTLQGTAMPRPTVWMYLPLNPRETVREISAIRLFGNFVALLLHTNQSRAVLFGNYYLDHGPGLQLSHLCTMNDAPARLYFNECDPVHGETWIRYLGIDEETTRLGDSVAGPVKDRPSRYPPSLIPSFPPPYSQHDEFWQYTNCRMEDVQEITPCIDRSLEYRSVIGILLRYGDGRRACLGQYRLDWVETSMSVNHSQPLRIGFARSPARLPYVTTIRQDEGTNELEHVRWLEVQWRGKLEWWISQGQCRLDYSDGCFSRRSKKLAIWD